MVILDAAEFDDDEEEYGDYQVRKKLCLGGWVRFNGVNCFDNGCSFY